MLSAQPTYVSTLHQHNEKNMDRSAESAYILLQFEPGNDRLLEISIHSPISGLEVLESTGLELEIKDFGDGSFAVCSIEGVGCPADDCFCEGNKFWNYEYWDGEKWHSYQIGASETIIEGNAVEGWRWGEFDSGEMPPATGLIEQR